MPTVTGLPKDFSAGAKTGTLYAEYQGGIDGASPGSNGVFYVEPVRSETSDTLSLFLAVTGYYLFTYESKNPDALGNRVTKGPYLYNVTSDVTVAQILNAQPVGTPVTQSDAQQAAAARDQAQAAAASVNRGQAGGTAPLDGNADVPQANLPDHLDSGSLDAAYVKQRAQRWDVRLEGVPIDGTTLADTAFSALRAAMAPGDVMYIPPGASIKLGNRHDVTKPIVIDGNDATFVQSSTAGLLRLTAAAAKSKLRNFRAVGPSGTTYAANSKAILLAGAIGGYVEDVTVESVRGEAWGNAVLWGEYVRRVTTRDVLTKNTKYAGQMFLSPEDVTLYNPMCDTLYGRGDGVDDCYPWAFTRDSTKSLTAAPRAFRGRVFGGYARNSPWESGDTHGGVDIKVFGYSDYNTKLGLGFVSGIDEAGNVVYSPQDCWAFGCTSEAGVSDGTAGDGFVLAGALGQSSATGGFFGCTAIHRGIAGNSNGSGGMRLVATRGAAVSGFRAIECSPHAVALSSENFHAVLDGVVATDPWSTDAATAVVGICGGANTFSLANSRLIRASRSGSFVARAGVYANSGAYAAVQAVVGGGNDFASAVDAGYVNLDSYLRQSFFKGNPVARAVLSSSASAADIVAELKRLGIVG